MEGLLQPLKPHSCFFFAAPTIGLHECPRALVVAVLFILV